MKNRFWSMLVAGVVALAGCSDATHAPLAPEQPSTAITAAGIDLNGVLEFATLPDLSGVRRAEKLIRASEGGFVELNGFRVDIPAGALSQDTRISIDLPSDATLGKHVLAEFGPHGTQFNVPVRITFPLKGVSLLNGAVEVGRWENGGWTSLGGTVTPNGDSLWSTTPHFSTYGGKYIMAGG